MPTPFANFESIPSDPEEVKKAIAAILKEHHVKIYSCGQLVYGDEPLTGREAREVLDELDGKRGTFKTIKHAQWSKMLDLLIDPAVREDEDLSDFFHEQLVDMNPEGDCVFEAPDWWPGSETFPTLVFDYAH